MRNTGLSVWSQVLLPGIVVQTSPDDRFPIRQEQLARSSSGTWQPFGSVIDARK